MFFVLLKIVSDPKTDHDWFPLLYYTRSCDYPWNYMYIFYQVHFESGEWNRLRFMSRANWTFQHHNRWRITELSDLTGQTRADVTTITITLTINQSLAKSKKLNKNSTHFGIIILSSSICDHDTLKTRELVYAVRNMWTSVSLIKDCISMLKLCVISMNFQKDSQAIF